MLYMKEDDMDEMLRRAAENYEVDAAKAADWDAVHAAVSFMVLDDLDWFSLANEIVAPIKGIESRLEEMDFQLEGTEERRVANMFGMRYGMTSDLRGSVMHQGRRRKAVIDCGPQRRSGQDDVTPELADRS